MGGTLSNVEANSLGKLLLDKDSVKKWWSGTGLEKMQAEKYSWYHKYFNFFLTFQIWDNIYIIDYFVFRHTCEHKFTYRSYV